MTSMFESNQIISHQWNRKSSQSSYSNSFTDKTLPEVKFDLSATLKIPDQKFNIRLKKSPADPANAILTVRFNEAIVMKIEIDNWYDSKFGGEIPILHNQLLEDLLVTFEITWLGFVKKLPSSCLYRHLTNLYKESDNLQDFTIVVGDKEIRAHKVILASQSLHFMDMFKSDLLESNNQLEINDIKYEIMQKVIEFFYTGEIDSKLEAGPLLMILSVAYDYSIVDLKKLCTDILLTKIRNTTACMILETATSYEVTNLIEKTILFMLSNKKAILKSRDFKELYDRKPEVLFNFITRLGM